MIKKKLSEKNKIQLSVYRRNEKTVLWYKSNKYTNRNSVNAFWDSKEYYGSIWEIYRKI